MGPENTSNIAEQPAAELFNGDLPVSVKNKKPHILVVTRSGHMAQPVMEYALNVAERLKYSIVAAYINTQPFYRDGGKRSKLFASAMQESSELFKTMGEERSIEVTHTCAAGKIGKAVKQICHSEKHIEFVVIDQGISMKEVSSQSPVPVFSVIYTPTKAGRDYRTTNNRTLKQGATGMSAPTSRKRHVKNCFIFGALTVGLYAAVFSNQAIVMKYFTKGGLFALLPVAVVFAVSYLHGNFTSSFWSALGIEGSKTATAKKPEVQKTVPASDIRKDTRPRAQVNA